MNNTISNTSFKANIKTLTKVSDMKTFDIIKENFAKATKKYPNDTLYITKTPYGAYSWHINPEKDGSFYNGEEIFTNSIDRHIEELGAKNFIKELVFAFKALILQSNVYPKVSELKKELETTKSLIQGYNKIAASCKANGKEVIANKYAIIAKRNKEKANRLSSELNTLINKFNNSIKNWSDKFKEIGQVGL